MLVDLHEGKGGLVEVEVVILRGGLKTVLEKGDIV